MLRINRSKNSLTRLADPGLGNRGILERYNLQKMIRNSAADFFGELGVDLKIIGEEVRPSPAVADRIDLLAIDDEGAAVIIELKRGSDKLQLLQSLTYAAMIAKWDADRFVKELARSNGTDASAEEEMADFLGDAAAALNSRQRIMLLAEEFDYTVLVTAEWLSEKLGFDVHCYRLIISTDGASEFLSCTCIFPPSEIDDQAARRKNARDRRRNRWSDWQTALAGIENKSVVDFFAAEIKAGREHKLGTRKLYFDLGEHRRFVVRARQLIANVRQLGRFADDIAFWQGHLSDPVSVKPVAGGERLRFRLRNTEDFRKFQQLLVGELQTKTFTDAGDADADDEGGDREN